MRCTLGRTAASIFVAICILMISVPGFAGDVAEVILGSQTIHFQPKVGYDQLTVRVSAPDGKVYERVFKGDANPVLQLPGNAQDGLYVYEIRAIRINSGSRDNATDLQTKSTLPIDSPMTQDGHFNVLAGSIVISENISETPNTLDDVVHLDDTIVVGSLCVGFDCANGENFGFDTFRLKENNLRIHFNDTSNSSGFPTTDWRIVINDSTSGGASYFAIEDSDTARQVFKIEANAKSNSIYVDDYGRVGFGTATPVLELHISDGDTPSVRLDQNGSSGWSPQVWDMCGNEANFFIRDVTGGSKLSFRIQPGAPTNAMTIKSDGNVGLGTWAPEADLEIERTGEDAQMLLQRTDGATAQLTAKAGVVNIGSKGDNPVRFMVNQIWQLQIDSDGSLLMGNGASCTPEGVWTNASSIDLKENVKELTSREASKALVELNPVKYNYKKNKNEQYVGFIAEEVPELVATGDRKTMSTMDVVGVLTKVLKDQQATIDQLKKEIDELKKANK